jgi:hypothetical protein
MASGPKERIKMYNEANIQKKKKKKKKKRVVDCINKV